MGTELTPRELMVLTLLREGKSNKEIGASLGISTRTVQKHLQRIYSHLRVKTRAEAIVTLYTGDSPLPPRTQDSTALDHV